MGRRRVLVVVEPALYESALSNLLENADVDVFSSHSFIGAMAGSFDVAILSGDLPDGVAVEVEIRLPAAENGTGDMTLHNRQGSHTIPVGDLGQILAAIEGALG